MNLIEYAFIVAIIVALVFFLLQYLKNIKSTINDYILNHYEDDKWTVQNITSLNIKEKIRNGVHVLDQFVFSSGWSHLPNSKTLYNRKVELTDKDDNECTKYIEIEIQNGNVVSFNEFDSYDI